MHTKAKHQYTFIQCFYWISGVFLFGYAAVFLSYKGLSDTLIGIAVGGSALVSIWMQPCITDLVQRHTWLTPKSMTLAVLFVSTSFYLLLGVFPLPPAVMILFYIFTNTLFNAATPLITSIGMEYINQGYDLNFFFSRGMGSFAFAVASFSLGQLLEFFRPGIITWLYIIFMILLMLSILIIKDITPSQQIPTADQEASLSVIGIMKENRAVCLFAVGFGLSYLANSVVTTYMVNLVTRAGGGSSALGLCGFINASSELPAMVLSGWLLKKISCRTLLKISSFFFLAKILVLFLAPSLPLVFLGYALQSGGIGIFIVVSASLTNQELQPKDRMKGQAIWGIVTLGFGSCIGNLAAGWILDTWGLNAALGTCVISALLGFLISIQVSSKKDGS